MNTKTDEVQAADKTPLESVPEVQENKQDQAVAGDPEVHADAPQSEPVKAESDNAPVAKDASSNNNKVRVMSPEARKKISEALKKRAAEKKASGATTDKTPAKVAGAKPGPKADFEKKYNTAQTEIGKLKSKVEEKQALVDQQATKIKLLMQEKRTLADQLKKKSVAEKPAAKVHQMPRDVVEVPRKALQGLTSAMTGFTEMVGPSLGKAS